MHKVTKEISIVVPSRGRPDKLLIMMNSALDCASSPELIEFVLYIDNDETSDYEIFNDKAIIIKGERAHMGEMFRRCIYKSNGRTIVICNDDVVVSTKKWDDIIYENLKLYTDNIFLLYPNDLNKGSELCTFPIFSKELFLQFPEILPKDLTLIDLHLRDLFFQLKGLGINRIKYLHNIVFEHLHYTLGKSSLDKTYSDRHRFSNDDLFVQYADLRFNLSSFIAFNINRKSLPKQIFNTKDMVPKMTSMRFFKENTMMLFSSNAPLLYRFKLWLYMNARRTYNIFIYRFQAQLMKNSLSKERKL